MSDSARYALYYGLTECFDHLHQCSKNNQNFEHLMEIISSKEVILLAHRTIKRNDGSTTPGVDGVTVKDIEDLPVERLVALVQNKFRWYVPKPVKRVEIPKESDPSKTRPLGIPCYVDRLCQMCIKLVLEPIAEAKFYKNSFGFRPNRSCENAIKVCIDYMNNEKLHYVTDVDIKSFFDRVDHKRLMQQLWRLGIHDRKLLAIIYAMLKAPIMYPDGTIEPPSRGVPQGGILSPLLANICLNDLDWYISNQWDTYPLEKEYKSHPGRTAALRRAGRPKVHIVRYADDFKIFCETREMAEKYLKDVTEWLNEKLGLETSPEKSGVTNLRRNYTCFLGIELKVRRKRKKEPGQQRFYTGRKREWVSTSRVKRKNLTKIEETLEQKLITLKSVNKADTAKVVSEYNSVVDGIINYFSMASQVSIDFASVQYNLAMRMHNRIEGISKEKPENYRARTKADKKYERSKVARYLNGCIIHPIGFAKLRKSKRFEEKVSNYTALGRSLQGIRTGVPPPLLAWIARHSPPDMPVELADNRISVYSSQKGKCAILKTLILPGGFTTALKDPFKTEGKYRFGNVLLLSPLANQIINEPKWADAKKIIQTSQLDDEQIKLVQKYRRLRKLSNR